MAGAMCWGMKLGERLKQARLDAGLSLRGAAKLLGVKHTSINDWETGKTKPNVARNDDIARVYNVDAEQLFMVSDDKPYIVAKNDIERSTILALRGLPEDLRRLAPGVLRGLKQSA
jgi:transcriptional regulator with XRE-family HTH domain